eukprot:GILJ01001661.1.p1 GENE.GILJ01001661.1~~GILJ01001661.1.p1  ORF type:complete len:464 (-),score=91.71 GILJ01001661.1:211-1563(-)
MSEDEEFEYEYESDGGNWDYGSDNDNQDEQGIQIENTFYEADDRKQDDPQAALQSFETVVKLESEKGTEVKWRFKALENIVMLAFRLGDYDKTTSRYQEMLTYMDQVTRNDASDSINTILDTVASSSQVETIEKMYQMTLEALRANSNERLWFATSVKLARLHLDMQDVGRLTKLIRDLSQFCHHPDGNPDVSKMSNLLEVYALEIQLCTITKNTKRMKEIYPKTQSLTAAIADPRIMGVIRESGGKMYLSEKKWSEAYNEFFEAFRNYQETGNVRCKTCLKYVVLANMLSLSGINPFEAREAKVYKDDPEIQAMVDLRQAYEANDINQIEKIINDKKNRILEDPFIRTYIEDLLNNIRRQVLAKRTEPYKRIAIKFLADEINVSPREVESLLVEMILDNRISGKIDQINGFLELAEGTSTDSKKYSNIQRWTASLGSLQQALMGRLSSA